MQKKEPLGIDDFAGQHCIQLLEGQDRITELKKTLDFIQQTIFREDIPQFQGKEKKVQFINYGSTELVYVLHVDDRKYTLLVKQPACESGVVKEEYHNLRKLYEKNPEHVVSPQYYFESGDGQVEMYLTPYFYQARCIATLHSIWGVYVPEPEYHFAIFGDEDKALINSSMIALLIKMYDTDKKIGIADCRVGGGDFILEKDLLDSYPLNYKNILNKMKLIAARKRVPIELDDCIAKIREEFVQTTYYKLQEIRNPNILINQKLWGKMTPEEIETGIQLGLSLREKDKQKDEQYK